MLGDLEIVGADRRESALALGQPVAAVVVGVDVEPIGLEEGERAQDLIGEHGIAETNQNVAARRAVRVRIGTKSVAAQSPLILGGQPNLLDR